MKVILGGEGERLRRARVGTTTDAMHHSSWLPPDSTR
jgi:hypothetical protein